MNLEPLRVLEKRLAPCGILLRGAFHFNDREGPQLNDGNFVRTLVLLGNIGGSLWEPFARWREEQPDKGGDHSLDLWSRKTIQPIADELGAAAYFPSDKPWWPFQQWAMRAEGLRASPLGLLIHPEYGLWHGYRGALGFADVLQIDLSPASDCPCDTCLTKPCLNACPANSISESRFDVVSCRSFLASEQGQAGCMVSGCEARNACPVGADYRLPVEQLAFHMAALSR